ncbi:hypothetical protein [Streptomyces sp. NBC_01508]|uniref:hypothetical protein n=1 Tax=Streptomyces sp. NBC_01508 TaxID=2903888 RepID=UPI00386613C9
MASTVWQVGCAAAALGAGVFLVDRALLWMERRGWVYYRRRKGLSSIGADFLQEVSPGAQAAKRGLEQERVCKNVRPAEEPPVHVDLDAGVVRIRRTGTGEERPG